MAMLLEVLSGHLCQKVCDCTRDINTSKCIMHYKSEQNATEEHQNYVRRNLIQTEYRHQTYEWMIQRNQFSFFLYPSLQNNITRRKISAVSVFSLKVWPKSVIFDQSESASIKTVV